MSFSLRFVLFNCLALAGVTCSASVARADEEIAVVDVQKVVSESIIGKAAKNNLEGEIKKAKVKLANLQSDFEKSRADLEKQASVLSEKALAERREGLVKKQRDAQKLFQETQTQLAKKNEEEIRKVLEEIRAVVEDVADDRDFEFVFEKDRQAVVFAADRIDITSEVIKRLDKKKVDL
ncbi:MAG: OmpH family outer membrane protein [Pseudomonadota bacterium]